MTLNVPITDAADLVKRTPSPFEGIRQYVATGDMIGSKISSSTGVTYDGRPSRADITVRSGDVLFAKMAGTRKTLVAEKSHEEMLFSTGFAVLEPKEGLLDSRYLYHYLLSTPFNSEKDRLSSGATQKAITNKALKQISLSLPPLGEQRRIATILDKADEIEQASNQSHRLKETLIRSVFIEMFGDLYTNPKGWELVLLNDLVDKLGDGIHGTPAYDENGDYYFINGTNLRNQKIEVNEKTKRINEAEYLKHKKELSDSTMFVSINGTVGNVAFYNAEPVMLGKSVCYFNVKEHKVSKTFLYYLFKSEYFTNYAKGSSTGSTIRNLSLKAMRNFPIPVPPINLQHQFEIMVGNISQMGINHSMETSKLLSDSLVQTMI